MSIGSSIEKRRNALGLSQPELAAIVGKGVNQQTISRIENGITKTSKHMPAILAALDKLEAKGVALPIEATSKLGLAEIRAVLEVLFHTLSNSDKAAEWAAEAVARELLEPQELPYGLDRSAWLRAETARILRELSEQVRGPNGLSKKS